jgi:hypothetical protein
MEADDCQWICWKNDYGRWGNESLLEHFSMAWNAIVGGALRAQSALTFAFRGIRPFLLAVLVDSPQNPLLRIP